MHSSTIARAKRTKRDPGALLPNFDDQVLTFPEWCRLNRVSERTGRRILAAPGAPIVTWLSEHRMGITIRANHDWQRSRQLPPPRGRA
jgi:hypothetical protein